MRRVIVTLFAYLPVLVFGAAPAPDGRWEGRAQIPGRELRLIVDLKETAPGVWAGSIIVPGFGIKGAPLSNLVVTGADLTFDVAHALGGPTGKPPSFRARVLAVDSMAGEMSQGGHAANFSLARTGPAQVDPPPRSTPVSPTVEGRWSGEFELGGYPRQVTITVENCGDAGATAEFVIVGKQTNRLPVDLVVQDGSFLRIESTATRINFEGRLIEEGGELRGIVELGPLELPLALRRTKGRAS